MASPKATFTITAVDRTKAAFKSIQGNLQATGRIATRTGLAITGAFAGIGAAAIRANDSVARMGDVIDRLGATTQGFQELKIAAEAVGVSQSAFEQGLQRLTRRAADAIDGNEQLAETFNELGISLDELSGLTVDQAFRRIAEGLQGIEGGGQQLLRFFRLFDVEGTDLIRVARKLNEEGFGELISQAEAAGAVLSREVIDNAQTARTQLSLLSTVLTTNLQTALAEVTPELEEIATNLINAATAAIQWFGAIDERALRNRQRELEGINTEIAELRAELERPSEGLLDEIFREGQQDIIAEIGDLENRRKEILAEIAGLETEIANEKERQLELANQAAGQDGTAVGEQTEGQKAAVQEQLTLEQRLAVLRATRTAERMEQERQLSEVVLEESEARKQAALDEANAQFALVRASTSAARSMLSIADSTGKKLKGIRIAAAVADTFAGANRAFAEHPWPLSAAVAASIIAAGLANVASISRGSGGGGGGATAVTPSSGGAAADGGGTGGGESRRTFNVEFRSGTGLYSESSLRSLFDALEEVAEDGTQGLSGRFTVEGL